MRTALVAAGVAVTTVAALQAATGTTLASLTGQDSATTTYAVVGVNPPTGVSGTCLLAVVSVSWTGASGRVDGYRLRRSSDGVTYADVGAVLPPGTTSTTDVRLLGRHYYKVRTVAGALTADSSAVSVTCL